MDPKEPKQCSLLHQTTDYNSSQTNLNISHDVTALIRYDIHLARIEKKLCDKVHALPNVAVNGITSQSSERAAGAAPASLAIDGNPAHIWGVGSCSSTDPAPQDNPWWLLDMQQEVDVAIVRVSNRHSYYNRMSNFEIRIGMNSSDFSQNALCLNMGDIAPRAETTNYPCVNTTRGRYLSIQKYPPYINGIQLQLCEVQVIPELSDTSKINIAPYGKAYQSSTPPHGLWAHHFGPASRAIDGFTNPDWYSGYTCTHNNWDTSYNWWMVDLQQNVTVALVRITNRNLEYKRLFNFEIRVGFNDTNFSQNSLCYYMPGHVGAGATEDFPCLTPTRGRYLTIQRIYPWGPSGSMILTLCEVQIFQTGC